MGNWWKSGTHPASRRSGSPDVEGESAVPADSDRAGVATGSTESCADQTQRPELSDQERKELFKKGFPS